MSIHHWFLPHKDTHQKAKLISWEAFLIYVLFFIALQIFFSILSFSKPGILGVSSSIDQKRIIELTNQERAKIGLSPVSENSTLDQAAYAKARNMFEENYWAHFAPSGKTPWDFILGSGYKFSYAGENLAKNFSTSEDVVSAWVVSASHKENLLSPKYKDIGIAVVDGILDGQQTTLVVQMFGTTSTLIAKAKSTPPSIQVEEPQLKPEVSISGEKINVPKEEYEKSRPQPAYVASLTKQQSTSQPILNPYSVFKTSALILISFLFLILILDLYVLYKRGVFRVSSSHFAHMSLLVIGAAALVTARPGSIL